MTRFDRPASDPDFPGPLVDVIDESLALLDDYTDKARNVQNRDALPSLLAQCQTLVEDVLSRPSEPVRLVHHLAGTGGTLICKWLATAPNAVLLSEIDPFSPLQIPTGKWPFAPTDILRLMRCNPRSADPELVEAVFLGALKSLHAELTLRGQRLVIRDHAHSHYCVGAQIEDRPSLLDIIRRHHPVRAVVTVRHPLDSFLSIEKNRFVHFQPQTLEEYCRRYTVFLDDHSELDLFTYEEFVRDSKGTFARLCEVLELPCETSAAETWQSFPLSGDSGRSSVHIVPRDRRQVPAEIRAQQESSPAYLNLCTRLGYNTAASD